MPRYITVISLLLVVALGAAQAAPRAAPVAPLQPLVRQSADVTTAVVTFDAPLLVIRDGATHVSLDGCLPDGVAGAPALPVYGLTLPIPEGCRPRTISITPGATALLPLLHPVTHTEEPLPLSLPSAAQRRRTMRDAGLYRRSTPYPDYRSGEQQRARRDRLHGDDLLTLALHPVQYIPDQNLLRAHGELTVTVTWEPIPDEQRTKGWRPRRKLSRSEAEASSAASPLVATAARKPRTLAIGTPGADSSDPAPQRLTTGGFSLPLTAQGPYDHVIIAPSNFIATIPAPWNLDALAEARRLSGLESAQVSVEWIKANYPGRDDPERIRAFIRDAYDTWNTRFVLLVGTHATVPARKLYCNISVATDQIPSDALYYGCLDGSFDRNGNNIFGELYDGDDGFDIDLIAEVFVGRFPAATTNDVANMVRKTLAYEALPASALGRIGHVGEYLGFGGEAEYATTAMEQIRLGATSGNFNSTGFLNSYLAPHLDATDTLYDGPNYRWARADMLSRFNQDFHVFNHLGHGSTYNGMKFNTANATIKATVAGLSNPQPYFIYSQACYLGAFDIDPKGWVGEFMSSAGGPFAAVLNTRYGWGYRENVDGPSQFFNRRFWNTTFNNDAYHVGAINSRSREAMRHFLSTYAANAFRWIYYELTLFGDPATPFAAPLLNIPPVIETPGLQQHYYPGEPIRVDTLLSPVSLVDMDSPRIIWRTDGDPEGLLRTNSLPHDKQMHFKTVLPDYPLDTVITFRLQAETRAGLTVQWPSEGKGVTSITEPRTLVVAGDPSPYGATLPDYGTHTIASGNVVQAWAPARLLTSDTTSYACVGSRGTGSASDTSTHTNTFVLRSDSQLTWLWVDSYLMRQTSNIPGLLASAVWFNTGATTRTATAPDEVMSGGKPYRFTGWWLDSARQPSPHSRAQNPLLDISMTTPHLAEARYMDASLDEDGNGLADWWECRYFGAPGLYPPDDDSDGDGFTLAEEFDDLTDPTTPISFPMPPAIRHTRLGAVQRTPPPYSITARITDSHSVTNARLRWRRNDEAWQSIAMTPGDNHNYSAILPPPAEHGDTIVYQIEASDPGGRTAMAGPYNLALIYPRASFGPAPQLTIPVYRGSNTTATLVITNFGNAALDWTLHPAYYEPVTPAATNTWALDAWVQPWSLSTNRTISAPFSFHGIAHSAGSYSAPPVHAYLRSPCLITGPGATLNFSYWIASELDKNKPGNSFDGMIIEVSTNEAVGYQQLPGSYTHLQTGWAKSPWPNNTPCFSGDGSEGWQSAAFDLSAYEGVPIWLRFVYGGDNNTDGEGVYIDDIDIGPMADWPAWLLPAYTNATLGFPSNDTSQIEAHVATLPDRDLRQRILLCSNDPVTPRLHTDLLIRLRRIPWIGTPTAAQTSTNGEGYVTLNVPMADPDGVPMTLTVQHAPDETTPYAKSLLFAPTATIGTPTLAGTNCVAGIATANGDVPATNLVTVQWDTRRALPALPPLVPAMRLLLVASNDSFGAAAPVVTAPFMVDNEPPAMPTGLVSSSHEIATWSRETAFAATWNASSDGDGIGGIRYRSLLAPGTNAPLDAAPLASQTSMYREVADGSNLWLAVQAQDACGNRSEIARLGPYLIDITAPDASNAWVEIERSAFGDYAVGNRLATRWGGFADTLSGLAYYQVLVQTPTTLTPYLLTPQQQAAVMMQSLNATNRVWVYAIDKLGNSSAMVGSLPVMVLDADGDWDGDGHTNGAEELAGTDATDPVDVLRLYTMPAEAPDGSVAIFWLSLEGRRYTLLHTPELTPGAIDWQPVPGHTEAPGTGGLMVHIPDTSANPRGFYRLLVEWAE
jgi:hypothetical protein